MKILDEENKVKVYVKKDSEHGNLHHLSYLKSLENELQLKHALVI